jgi:hypothetical protein
MVAVLFVKQAIDFDSGKKVLNPRAADGLRSQARAARRSWRAAGTG